MKALLHMCALSARRSVPDLRDYYLRKPQREAKRGMLVMNAIRFKLLLRVFACVNGSVIISVIISPLVKIFRSESFGIKEWSIGCVERMWISGKVATSLHSKLLANFCT